MYYYTPSGFNANPSTKSWPHSYAKNGVARRPYLIKAPGITKHAIRKFNIRHVPRSNITVEGTTTEHSTHTSGLPGIPAGKGRRYLSLSKHKGKVGDIRDVPSSNIAVEIGSRLEHILHTSGTPGIPAAKVGANVTVLKHTLKVGDTGDVPILNL